MNLAEMTQYLSPLEKKRQNSKIAILGRNFLSFFGRFFRNFAVFSQLEVVFSPSVKKELKNSSIWLQKRAPKNREFLMILQIVKVVKLEMVRKQPDLQLAS